LEIKTRNISQKVRIGRQENSRAPDSTVFEDVRHESTIASSQILKMGWVYFTGPNLGILDE